MTVKGEAAYLESHALLVIFVSQILFFCFLFLHHMSAHLHVLLLSFCYPLQVQMYLQRRVLLPHENICVSETGVVSEKSKIHTMYTIRTWTLNNMCVMCIKRKRTEKQIFFFQSNFKFQGRLDTEKLFRWAITFTDFEILSSLEKVLYWSHNMHELICSIQTHWMYSISALTLIRAIIILVKTYHPTQHFNELLKGQGVSVIFPVLFFLSMDFWKCFHEMGYIYLNNPD